LILSVKRSSGMSSLLRCRELVWLQILRVARNGWDRKLATIAIPHNEIVPAAQPHYLVTRKHFGNSVAARRGSCLAIREQDQIFVTVPTLSHRT